MRKVIFLFFALSSLIISSCSNTDSTEKEKVTTPDSLAYPESVKDLSEQINATPQEASLYFERCQKLMLEKNWVLAYQDAKTMTSLEPENASYLYTLGVCAYENNEVADAITALKRAVELKKDYQEAYLRLARIQLDMMDYDDSRKTLEQLTKEKGETAEAYFLNGMIKKLTQDTTSAIRNFQKAVALNNDHYDSYMQLGLLYGSRQDKLGIDYLNNALRLKELSTEALYARGLLYQDLKKYKEAVADYRKIIEINAEYAPAYYNIGWINFQMEKYDLAVEAFNEAVIADPQFARAYYMRGLSHQGLGNNSDARTNYEACLKIDPNFKPAREMLDVLSKK